MLITPPRRKLCSAMAQQKVSVRDPASFFAYVDYVSYAPNGQGKQLFAGTEPLNYEAHAKPRKRDRVKLTGDATNPGNHKTTGNSRTV